MLKSNKLRDLIIVPKVNSNKPNTISTLGVESINLYNRYEFINSVRELDNSFAGLEDASQVLEEMKKVIIQHEANVQAEKAEDEQEGVGETEDGKLVADTAPEGEGDAGEDAPADGGDMGGGDMGSDGGDAGDAPDMGDEGGETPEGESEGGDEGSEEGTDESSEGGAEEGEGTAEASEEDVDAASEEKESTEESAKDMNMAGEMLSGALFGARYKDLKSVLGIKSIGLNNITTSPLYTQQESLDNLKEVKSNVSDYFKDRLNNFISTSKEALTNSKEELQDITNKATALQKSIEVKEVGEGNLNPNIELKPYAKILLQNGITKENIKSYIERTKPIINTLVIDNSRLDRIFQLASNLSSSNVSNELREKLFWEFVRPIMEATSHMTLDPISQFTNSKNEEGQSELMNVSNQDMSSNGLSLQIKPVKYDDRKGVYNSLTDYNIFTRVTQVYPNLTLDDNIPLTRIKELANDICTTIQESKDMVNETIENTLNSIKSLEDFDSSKYNINKDLVDDILSGLGVIVYDHSAFTLAMLSKLRKSLEVSAVLTSSLNTDNTAPVE